MTIEVTYDEYLDAGGTMGAEAFDAALPRAQASVDHLIGINEVTDKDAYVRAIIAAMGAYEGATPGGVGFSIGAFRMEGSGSPDETRAQAIRAAYEVLATTGMVYGGVA